MSSRRQAGFTLVELLVVIAIIGVLVALLLPAVQSAREAARRAQCQNHLKQLGIAIHNYHDNHGQFPLTVHVGPPFTWGTSPNHKGSWLVRLLPYVDQTQIYDSVDFDADTVQDSELPSGRKVHELVVNTFICPSDDHPGYWQDGFALDSTSNGQRRALSNYSASMGSQANSPCGTHNNYFGNGPVVRADTMNPQSVSGVFSHVAWAARLNDIEDGTTQTIALGEIRPRCAAHTRDGWMDINSLYTGTGIAINFNTCEGAPGTGSGCNQHQGQWGASQGFKSIHQGGCHFLLCDGTVKFIGETIDMVTYQRLGDRRDGEIVGTY
ncbi:Type II secretion system protein G precursor [Planctomycetes bacterium Pan216]|uniref:Type II secretion system protein G n=1 Tax=Kolteria novifilia TaxID=2527975 RepID=A0A518B2C4_9BACT|nr:Type II secretion system protein G precursor [Planctomycetes bacterium Pan216]